MVFGGSQNFPGTDFRKDSGPGIKQVSLRKNAPHCHLAKCFDTAKTHSSGSRSGSKPSGRCESVAITRAEIAWNRIAWSSEALGLQARGKIVEE